MGITAAQFVWEPEGDEEETVPHLDPQATSSSSAVPPTAPLHSLPEEGTSTTTGTRKRVRQKATPTEANDEHI